jgi:hypothetical protein
VCLEGILTEVRAIGAVDMDIDETRGNDAARGIQNIQLLLRLNDSIELSINIPLTQGKIFAENKTVFN